jgi:hypothetical protein
MVRLELLAVNYIKFIFLSNFTLTMSFEQYLTSVLDFYPKIEIHPFDVIIT